MDKKQEMKLTEGSSYRIISIGGRDASIETEGVFRGFANLGIDEGGVLIELSDAHGDMKGKLRIVPLHAILSIDVLDAKETDMKDDLHDAQHFYG